MAELTRDTAKRRVERYLKTLNQRIRISKSIRDKGLYGEAYIVDLTDTSKIIKDKTTIKELLSEYGLLLEGETYA